MDPEVRDTDYGTDTQEDGSGLVNGQRLFPGRYALAELGKHGADPVGLECGSSHER